MKYIDLILMFFLISTFFIFISSSGKIYEKLFDKNFSIENETCACRFISESFKNTCDGNGFENLNQWQKTCREMWNLKYIAWCDARDFLPIPNEYDKKVLYGKWIGNNWEGEIYWELKNEK